MSSSNINRINISNIIYIKPSGFNMLESKEKY